MYKYTCEQCGAETEWIKKEMRMDAAPDRRAGSVLSPGLRKETGDGYSSEQADRIRAGMRNVLKSNVENGDYSAFDAGARCPGCGARQSWLNPELTSTVVLSIIATMAACVIAGTFVGFIISMPGLAWALPAAIALGAAAGILLSIFKTVLPYTRDKNASKEAVNNKAKNLPEIDWEIR